MYGGGWEMLSHLGQVEFMATGLDVQDYSLKYIFGVAGTEVGTEARNR